MNKEIRRQAEQIAKKVSGTKVGFVEIILPIITALLPALIEWFKSCRQPDPDPPTPQQYVASRYDSRNETYSPRLLRLTIKETLQAARKEKRKISRKEAEETAVATLDHIRTADDKVVGACLRK